MKEIKGMMGGSAMVKVVIADDEERVCRLIQALVDWEALGMQVIGTAANGIEAIERIKEDEPDILITDIRMPGCDGLELISKVRKLKPNLQIIIISGYAHFEYARTAIKYNVGNYLLKPINKEELTQALSKMKSSIHEERKVQEESESIKKSREEDLIKLRRMLIQDVLENQQQYLTEEVINTQYHLQVQKGRYQCLCIRFDLENVDSQEISEHTQKLIWDKLNKIFESNLAPYCYEWVLMPKALQIYGMINYTPKYKEEIRKKLRGCLKQIEVQKNLLGGVEITFGLGSSVTSPNELYQSLVEAEQAMNERLVEGTGKLIEYKDFKSVLYEKNLLDKYARHMNHALETLNTKELESAIDELKQSILETPYVHGWEILEVVKSAGEMFAMRLAIQIRSEELVNFQNTCNDSKSVDELFKTITRFSCEHLEGTIDTREKDSVRAIRLAKQYIQNHYSEQITLEEVSGYVNLSPAYFSALFKKEAELGFVKYLMQVRMEQAKMLLRDTNLSVVEVCVKVGYNDKKHFTHSFEKIVGVKPVVYRKLYG